MYSLPEYAIHGKSKDQTDDGDRTADQWYHGQSIIMFLWLKKSHLCNFIKEKSFKILNLYLYMFAHALIVSWEGWPIVLQFIFGTPSTIEFWKFLNHIETNSINNLKSFQKLLKRSEESLERHIQSLLTSSKPLTGLIRTAKFVRWVQLHTMRPSSVSRLTWLHPSPDQ